MQEKKRAEKRKESSGDHREDRRKRVILPHYKMPLDKCTRAAYVVP
jgi:hypothetical protein